MTLQPGAEQTALRVGPRRPMPFPDSGKRVQLLICPKCRQKGLLWYYAPYELGYQTECIKCGTRAVLKRRDMSMTDIQNAGGFTPRRRGVRTNARWGLDATQLYEESRSIHSLGYKRAYSQGFIPAPVDQRVR